MKVQIVVVPHVVESDMVESEKKKNILSDMKWCGEKEKIVKKRKIPLPFPCKPFVWCVCPMVFLLKVALLHLQRTKHRDDN